MKTHFNHHHSEKISLSSIICFAHVEFKSHVSLIPSLPRVERVKDFIGYNDIICCQPIRNESTLGRQNYLMENPFKPISQHLSNDFIDNVAQANRSEISNFEWIFDFGNKCYKSMINGI